MCFWNQRDEINFFEGDLKKIIPPEKLFYKLVGGYFAYAPKGKTTEGQTLQSRNALIGQYTEKWCMDFLKPIARILGFYSINGVVCPELGLTGSTNADIAFCTTNSTKQSAKDIKLIFEVKMSIVNNYSYNEETKQLKFVGNYTTHKGIPSILRSDSMLKAIGKSINIRVSGMESSKIPIIIVGNSPIAKSYRKKVDFLKNAGVIQGFISLYSNSLSWHIKETSEKGFQMFNNYSLLQNFISELVSSKMIFFPFMLRKEHLGRLIARAAKEVNEVGKAEKFFQLLNKENQ